MILRVTHFRVSLAVEYILSCLTAPPMFSAIFIRKKQFLWLYVFFSRSLRTCRRGSALRSNNWLIRNQIRFFKSWSPLRSEANTEMAAFMSLNELEHYFR